MTNICKNPFDTSKIDHIILVKGTFTSDSEINWTSEKSNFRNKLEFFGYRNVEVPPTYFGNSANKRFEASEEIQKCINGKDKCSRLLIIAHSHGGNAVLKALDMIDLRPGRIDIVTLATPFIQIYPARSDIDRLNMVFYLAITAIAPIIYLSSLFVHVSHTKFWGIVLITIILFIVTAVSVAIYFTLKQPSGGHDSNFKSKTEMAVDNVNYSELSSSNNKLLVIRGVSDEAAAAIGTGAGIAALSRWTPNIYDNISWYVFFVCFVLGGLGGIYLFWSPEIIKMTVFFVGFGLFYGIGLFCYLYACSRASVFLLIASNSAFGFDLVSGLLGCEFDVSTAPSGSQVTIRTLSPDDLDSDTRRNEMRHAIYNHPMCVPAINEWLESKE